MITKKKSKAARLGALALALTLVTTCLMGGTMARYVSEVTGSATATVAAWSFKADSKAEIGKEFSQVNLGDTTHRQAYVEGDIADNVIAPGTTGSFDIVIDGYGSEVGVDYTMSFNVAKKDGVPIQLPEDLTFKIDKGDGKDPSVYTMGDDVTGTIAYADTTTNKDAMKKTLTVKWAWAFGADDTKDVKGNDNSYADNDWVLDITVTGKQTELVEKTTPSN